MKPTPEQMKKDIAEFRKKKDVTPSPQQIKSDIASFKASKSPNTPTAIAKPTEKKVKGGFLGEVFTGNTQRFGRTIGESLVAPSAAKKFAKSQQAITDTETDILQRLKTASPEDRPRLMEILELNRSGGSKVEDFTGDVINKTWKEIAGEAIGTGVEALTGGLLSKGAGTIINAGSNLQKAKNLVKVGAQYGGATGVSEGLKDNKSLPGVIFDGVKYGAGGALGGRLFTGLLNKGASVVARNTDLIPKLRSSLRLDDARKITEPVLTTAEKKAKQKATGSTSRSIFSEPKIIPNKFDDEVSDSVSDIVKRKNKPEKNRDLINNAIGEIDTGTKDLLKQYNIPFNDNQLLKGLNAGKDDLKFVFTSDPLAEKTYDTVVESFMEILKKKNMSGLLDARQGFDKLPAVKVLLRNERLGENTKREIVRTVRKKANEYIINNVPEEIGEQVAGNLAKQTRMFNARDNIVDQLVKQLGTTAAERFFKTRSGKVIKGATGALGAAGVVALATAALRK